MLSIILILLLGITAIATASIFVKLAVAPALIIAAYRMALASLVILPYVSYKQVWRQWEGKEIPWLTLSGVLLAFHFAFWIASLKYTSVASSVVLVTTHPLFVGLGSWLFLKEPLPWNLILGIILSVTGSGLIGFGDIMTSREALFGDGLALLGAMVASGYLLVGRKMRKCQELIAYIFPVYSSAALILIGLAMAFQKPFFGYTPSTYLFFLLLALIPQLIGHTAFNWALKYLSASKVSVAILGEPIGSTLLAYFILHEGLSFWKISGGLTILAGIWLSLRKGG